MIFAFASTKFTPFLSGLGYSAFERGIMLSSYAITNIIFQLLFGLLSDKYQTMKKIVLLCVGIYGISTALLFSSRSAVFSVYLLLVALSGGLLNTCCGLYDTWILGCNKEISQKMSFVKTFGSIGWALGSMIASFLIFSFSYCGLAVSIMVIVSILTINIMILPDIEKIEGNSKVKAGDILELLKDRQYILLVIIYFLMYSMVVVNNCTVIDKMIYLNATDSQISFKWSLQSLLEIPTYLAGSFLLEKVKGSTLAKISAVMMTIQFLIFAFAQNPEYIIIGCFLQVFSTPIVLITSKTLIQEIAPPKLRSSSQLIALSIFMGGSSLIMLVAAGFLSVNIGFDFTLASVATLGCISFVFLSVFTRFRKEIR